MKTPLKTFLILAVALAATLISCDDDIDDDPVISKNGDTGSHHQGANCSGCHNSNQITVFSVSGTIFQEDLRNTAPNGMVMLYTGKNGSGSLVKTIEVDANGNFYTTENIDFTQALYPVAESARGASMFMPRPATSGACNSCHGTQEEVIWVN
jgi:cytochrome c553